MMFKKKKQAQEPDKKRPVIEYRGMGYSVLDSALCIVLTSANIILDADEVIACLEDSERYRTLKFKAALERLEEKTKELESARQAVLAASNIGEA